MNERAKAALAKYREEVRLGLRPKPVRKHEVQRVCNKPLDGFFGRDKNKRLVWKFIPGTDRVDDLFEIRPQGSHHTETLAVVDIYRLAIQARINRRHLEKARARKAALEAKRLSAKIRRVDRRLARG